MGKHKEEAKDGPPAYLVSFCDMMTLILTFFILLVSMSKEQKAGLVAKGVGSFIIAVKSHGMNGIMSGSDKAAVFENMRRKFNLPPEEDPERRENFVEASNLELIKTKLLEKMQPHDELTYPNVVEFFDDSAEIPQSALTYLRKLALSLQPKFAQTLVIEGHANDAGPDFLGDNRQLANARAIAVRDFLIEEFGFNPDRLEARSYWVELGDEQQNNRSVNIRLVTPSSRMADN